MRPSTHRYCQCGNRLSTGNPGTRCPACERQALQLRASPPDVPGDFWLTEQMREALHAQHIGRVSRAYRKHPAHTGRYGPHGIPQELLGTWLGLTQAQISRIENGPPVRNLDTLCHWARMLRIPPRLLWFRLSAGHHQRPATLSPLQPLPQVPRPDGRDADNPDAAAMRGFRAADLQVGGGHMYPGVISYLHEHVAPRIFGTASGPGAREAFTAASALTEMAGWMAHDAGNDVRARQHLERSLALARTGGDRQMCAHVLGSLSHLASHLGEPDTAISLAVQGQSALAGPETSPALHARLLALEARGRAARHDGDHEGAARLLLRAERMLELPPAEPASAWVSRYDAGSLASDAGRSLRELGDLSEARRQAEQVIAARPAHRVRSHAFGQISLAEILILQNKPEHACDITARVLATTASLSSYLVLRKLVELRLALRAHDRDPAASAFLVSMGETLRERLRQYHWLPGAGRPSIREEE